MEVALRAALVSWLAGDTVLSTQLNAITEEAPVRASLPWASIAASWSAGSPSGAALSHCTPAARASMTSAASSGPAPSASSRQAGR